MFKPQPKLQRIPIVGEHACYVIDDALLDPERMQALAAEHWAQAERSEHNAFPGPELRLPDALTAQLVQFFDRQVRDRLGARRTLRAYSRLSMVTDAPHTLQPRQWICHRDRMQVPAEHCVLASVLYLFHDARLGGTGFYWPAKPPAEIDRLVHDSGQLNAAEFSSRYAVAPGYQTGSNAWFERLCVIPPRWNRLIFYDGGLFHCSHIAAPELLSADPRQGRLTMNGFFTCRRRLVV